MRAGLMLIGLVSLAVVMVLGVRGFGPGQELVSAPGSEVSPESAGYAGLKMERLGAGEEVRLSDAEVMSLLRYHPDFAVVGFTEMDVFMAGDTLRLSARVPAERLPDLPELETLRLFLPDTVPLVFFGTIRPLEGGVIALEISTLEAMGMPIPARLHLPILSRLGLLGHPGLSGSAIPLSLPAGVTAARVELGQLVLTP